MTQPDGGTPSGSLNPLDAGAFADWASLTEETIAERSKAPLVGVAGSYTNVQNAVGSEVRTPIATAQGSADVAVTTAQAAANQAASADATAASASDRASYWETEFVVASAGVVLGVNELLLGPVQNVPGGLTRTLTDMHIGFITQPGGLTFELKKWSADGTSSTVLGTYSVAANVTRANWAGLGFVMATRERVFINITSVTGSIAPVVCQVLIFGVMA